MRKALLIPIVVLLVSIVSLSPILVSAQPPGKFIKECMPDFGQHSSCWCWVGAAANSFYWWRHSGGKPTLYPDAWDLVDPLSTNPDPLGLGPDPLGRLGRDGIDNDQDGRMNPWGQPFDEDPYDGMDNDGDGLIDEDGVDWYDDMDDWMPGPAWDGTVGLPTWQPNPGYQTLLKKIAEATFRDKNQDGIKQPIEKNYIYSEPVYKWDYVLGLYYLIKSLGADLIVHDKIDPNPPGPGIYEPYPGDGLGGRRCQADLVSRGITPANAHVLIELGIIVEFSNITLEQFEDQIWKCHDCILWLRRADGMGPFDHVVTGVGYNQTTVPKKIYYSDPWTHTTVPPHNDNPATPANMPDHNTAPGHSPSPYDVGRVIKENPLEFEAPDGTIWRVINMIKIYQKPAVGGVWVPVDKLGLLAPYIALASTIISAVVATAVLFKRKKK